MKTQDGKMHVSVLMVVILSLSLFTALLTAQVEMPDVNMEVEGAVPFELVMKTAQEKAEALWGEAAPGDAIPCCDDDGDLVAYMVPFAIGASEFPAYGEIFRQIQDGRAIYDELTKTLNLMQEEIPGEDTELSENTAMVRPETRFDLLDESSDTQDVFAIATATEGDTAGFMNARSQAKELMYGVDDYGTIFVSARYDRFPIPLCSHYLSPFFSVGDLAAHKAREILGTEAVTLSRYYFLGRNGGQFFEFASEYKKVLIEAFHLEKRPSEKVLVHRGQKPRPAPQMMADMNAAWDLVTLGNPNGGRDGSKSDHTVNASHLVPDIDWCRGCSPTSAAMAIGYWDNFVNGITYTGFGKLIDYWCDLSTYSDGTGSLKNVPNLLEELRIAFDTNVAGGTNPNVIDEGIEEVCNDINHYNFNSNQYYADGGDWNWSRIKQEIDGSRPCVWSCLTAKVGHSLCAWGYTDAYYVITYSTWGRGRDDWYYKKYDNGTYLTSSHVHTVVPSGSTHPHTLVLDSPDGGEKIYSGETCTIQWYQHGTLIHDADIYYSNDGGASWILIDSYVPSSPDSWNSYDWHVSASTNSDTRVRIYAYDSVSNYISADGSFENFAIIDRCDLHDDGEKYRSFTPQTAVVGKGTPFTAKCDVRNSGDEASGSFKVDFYASLNTTITTYDHYLDSVTMPSIPAGNWEDCDLTCNLPVDLPVGVYHIGWIIDSENAVTEADESNNTAYKEGYQFTVLSKPDLYDAGAVYQSFGPGTVHEGQWENIVIKCDVINGGGVDSGVFDVSIYASLNTTITTNDYYIGKVRLSNVQAGDKENCDFSGPFPINVPVGTYYLGWIIDSGDEVDELDEGNNKACKTNLKLKVIPASQPPVPDIKVNGNDGNFSLPSSEKVRVTLALDPGDQVGVTHDAWVYVEVKEITNHYCWVAPGSWYSSPAPKLSFAAPLQTIHELELFNTMLPPATFTFHFALDEENGVYEGTYEDSLTVTIY